MNTTASDNSRTSSDRVWRVLSCFVMAAYAFVGFLAVNTAIGNHAGGLATSIMDGVDSLGLSSIWELQSNLRENRLYMMLMMWGFQPIDGLISLFFGDTWTTLYLDLFTSVLFVVVGGWVVFRYSLDVANDPRLTFLLVVVYFLLPVTFANTVYWYGQPVFIMIVGSIYLMRRGWRWPAVLLMIWAHGCHPMSTPVFLGLSWSAFKMDLKGRRPILPGLEKRDRASAISWRVSWITCAVLALWTVFLVVGSRLVDFGSERGLLWDFFKGKFDSGTIPLNFSQTVFFLLPMLFLPLFSRVWAPALIIFIGYMLFGSQGVVTGFVLPGAALSMLASGHFLGGLKPRVRTTLASVAVLSAVLVNLLVPWTALFPMYPDPLTGGIFAPHSWAVQAGDSATNTMIRQQIPKNTPRCLTSWQIGPVMAERCDRVTTLSFPFRREKYSLQDFLDFGDNGRIAGGFWDYVLIDTGREAFSPGLDELQRRLDSFGWQVVGRTGESVLYGRP